MFWLEGHTIAEVLLEGEVRTLYRGYRDTDGTPVLVSALNDDFPNARDVARLRHEYLILRELALPCAPTPLGLTPCRNGVALVVSDAGKRPLTERMKRGRQDLGSALRIGIAVARALDRVHLRGVVHKDVCPANILVEEGTLDIELMGFAHASRLPREDARLAATTSMEGTLAYMAPEQTGRMSRVVDHRADLYAFGVTLYELLTGALPFAMDDPLGLAHAHIARTPAPPHARMPELPRVVSDIVMKLLAKSPDDRYHRAAGVEADLAECAMRWQKAREIEPFALGRADLGDELVLPQKLYGREIEQKALALALERASSGKLAVVVVSGPRGVGKTALASELRSAVAVRGGRFAEGSPDDLGGASPCALLASALRSLVRQILAGPAEQARAFVRELGRTLGEGGSMLVDLVPELAEALGEREAPHASPALPATASNERLSSLARALLDAASREAPLVLFLDDLDAADATSIGVVRALVEGPSPRRLCVVVACRERPSDERPGPLDVRELGRRGAPVTEIALGPLSPVHVRLFVADALGTPEAGVAALADVLAAATHGNPFFLREVLRALHAEGFVRFDPQACVFRWDLELVRGRLGAADVHELVRERIAALPPRTAGVLGLASCLGKTFDLEQLALAAGRPMPRVAEDLWPSLEAGLIAPLSPDYRYQNEEPTLSAGRKPRVLYAFAHEHVHEVAYASIAVERRAAEHLAIGRQLSSPPRRDVSHGDALAAVRQLNLGEQAMTDPKERVALAETNLGIGRRARAVGALSDAVECFSAGLVALAGRSPHELWFSLGRDYCECAVALGDDQTATRLVAELERGAATRLERVEACRLLVAFHVARQEQAEALTAGARGLGELGVVVPEGIDELDEAIEAEVRAIQASLGKRPPSALATWPIVHDPDSAGAMSLLLDLFTPAFEVSPAIAGLVSAVLTRLSIVHGNTEASAYAYATYGFFLATSLGRHDEGHAFAELALALEEERGEGLLTSRVRLVVGSMLHTRRPRRVALFHFLRAAGEAVVFGDSPYVALATAEVLGARFELGDDLARACDEAERSLGKLRRTQRRLSGPHGLSLIGLQVVRCLLGRTRGVTSLSDDGFDEATLASASSVVLFHYQVRRAELLLLHDDPASAARAALAAEERLQSALGTYLATELSFWLALALLLDTKVSPAERAARLVKVDACIAELAALSARSPENYERKWKLAGAERARASGDELAAMELYEKAVRAAAESGVSRDEALANELAARFHLERRRDTVARAYMGEAYQAYLRWGAITKVEALRERYRFLLPGRMPGLSDVVARGGELLGASHFDLAAVMRAAQAIAEEIVLDVLLDRVMRVIVETAGAQRAVLLLDRSVATTEAIRRAAGDETPPELVIEATMTIDPDRVLIGSEAAAAVGWELPQSIVDEVAVTRAPVVLGGSRGYDRFSKEPHLVERRPRSLLCLAMAHRGRLSGVLYLENRVAADVFSPARVSVASFLSSQAAIAVENALLVASIQRMSEVQRRTNEVLENEVMMRTSELERELEQRERAELEKAALSEAMIRAQAERLMELSTPLLPILDGVVVMPLLGAIDEPRAAQILSAALAGVSSSRASILILDITGVRSATAHVTQTLLEAARAVKLLGAEVIISGVRAEVARTLVGLGASMQGIVTKATLKDAITFALARTRRPAGSF